ncbi:odorant receptor Or2-like [Phymastichus coffea]|uniref:odorant receptor Or2-like n=1 Tax=Phymastichus coffea TaxID=108790 RepID=UPI00273AD328|nr:odorant receptor Or2-like [Phymastichus coffea]
MHMSLEGVLWPNIYLLTTIGIWPLPSNATTVSRLFTYFRIFLHVTLECTIIMGLIYTIWVNWGNIFILSDCSSIIFSHFLIVFKFTYIILHRHSCIQVLNKLKEFWEISQEEKERQCFEYFAIWGKTVTISCAITGFANVITFFLTAIFNEFKYQRADNQTDMRRILIIDTLYGFDYQQSPVFEILIIWQMMTLMGALTSVVATDCTAMSIILHLTGQFALISARLRAIGKETCREKIPHVNGDVMVIEIRRCIAHHQHVIRVTDELNAIIGPMATVHVLTAGLIICTNGYSLIKSDNCSEIEIIKFAGYFICMIIQLSLWCWSGELLIQESRAIAQTVFLEISWFTFPTTVQRDLILIVLRSQKQCQIVSFLQIMCRRKITEVFNTAASYLALLRSIQE